MKEPAEDGLKQGGLIQCMNGRKGAQYRTSAHQTNRHLDRAQQTKQWGADRQMCQNGEQMHGKRRSPALQGQALLTLPDRLCEVGSNKIGPDRSVGNQRRQFELARQQRASQSPSSLLRRQRCFRREIVQRKGALFRRSGLEEGLALKALGAAKRLRLPLQLSRLAESLDGRRYQYPHPSFLRAVSSSNFWCTT